jgi:dTDP-4-amino-4,6-dideoxygalactose transaminase
MSAAAATPVPIAFQKPCVGPEEEAAVLSVLRSGWLTTGEEAAAFEREFAAAVGARHALALSSATAGLHLALEALGTGPGSAVVTSTYTFAATAEVARYLGADPVFVDIDPRTLNMDPARLEEAVLRLEREGRKVSAIIPVHVAGLPCDMDAIRGIARGRGISVVEDAAHSFPARLGGGFVGTLGEAGVYSFYATKTITTGEGGMLVTANDEVARRVRVMRLHGIDRDIWNRYKDPAASWRYDVVAPGYKYNLTDLAAAIGRAQLRKAWDFLERRRAIVRRYAAALDGRDWVETPAWSDVHAWHLFIIRLRLPRLAIARDRFIQELQARGIGVSVHFIPLHLMTYYRERYGHAPEDFPAALDSFQRCISLPLSPSLTDGEVERVIEAVTEIGQANRT